MQLPILSIFHYSPWLLVRVPGLFRQYREDIEFFRQRTTDDESAALHESLYHLYLGRLRFKVFGWLAKLVPLVADWVLAPFDVARSRIGDAKDIHIHSRIDVLAYRAVALANLRRCKEVDDIEEIDRLVAIFNDGARTEYWRKQKGEIERCCRQGDAP